MNVRPLVSLFALLILASSADAAAAGPNYSGQLISVDLRDTDIRSFFSMIGEISHRNVVVHNDVSGKVRLTLKDVPWDQVLDIVLRQNGLYALNEGNVILIVPTAKVAEMMR